MWRENKRIKLLTQVLKRLSGKCKRNIISLYKWCHPHLFFTTRKVRAIDILLPLTSEVNPESLGWTGSGRGWADESFRDSSSGTFIFNGGGFFSFAISGSIYRREEIKIYFSPKNPRWPTCLRRPRALLSQPPATSIPVSQLNERLDCLTVIFLI